MNANTVPSPATLSASQERKIILLLCFLAAIHVFIFSAAFPFFNNVDEEYHFDMTLKYAQGHVPGFLETFSEEGLPYIAIFGSPEYHHVTNDFPDNRFPAPLWKLPEQNTDARVMQKMALWKNSKNYESAQPPLYYTLTGLCWNLAQACGLHNGFLLLYCVRFLNGIFIGALVWTGYVAARLIFPDRLFLRLGVPALIAFVPQSAFYSIQNDVLSSLSFGWLFICVLRWLRAENPGVWTGIVMGLTLSATALAKLTNLPLLAVAATAMLFKISCLAKAGKWRAALPALEAFAACGGLFVGGWLLWTKLHFGDFTGAAMKAHFLGWTTKPFIEWWHHPIFTPGGFWTFLSGNLETLWLGETIWHGKPLYSPTIDLFYAIISILLVVLALPALLPKFKNANVSEHGALLFAFACFGVALAFFGFLSIIYDFHDCFYPSRDHPYFTSGRLLLGALIPFLLLFVFGMDRALNRLGTQAKFLALAGLILFMIIAEIKTDWPVFSSQYNWFHM